MRRGRGEGHDINTVTARMGGGYTGESVNLKCRKGQKVSQPDIKETPVQAPVRPTGQGLKSGPLAADASASWFEQITQEKKFSSPFLPSLFHISNICTEY
jgi:hypothetical protein